MSWMHCHAVGLNSSAVSAFPALLFGTSLFSRVLWILKYLCHLLVGSVCICNCQLVYDISFSFPCADLISNKFYPSHTHTHTHKFLDPRVMLIAFIKMCYIPHKIKNWNLILKIFRLIQTLCEGYFFLNSTWIGKWGKNRLGFVVFINRKHGTPKK